MTKQTKTLLIGLAVALVIAFVAYYWYNKSEKDKLETSDKSRETAGTTPQVVGSSAAAPKPKVSVQVDSSGLTADSILKIGDSGEVVKAIQNLLNANGYKGKNGKALSTDGSLGANTWYAMNQANQMKYQNMSLSGMRTAVAMAMGNNVPTQQQASVFTYPWSSGANGGTPPDFMTPNK